MFHLVPPSGPREGLGRRAVRLQRAISDPAALRRPGHSVWLLSIFPWYMEGAEDEAPEHENGGGICKEIWAAAVDEEVVSMDEGGRGGVLSGRSRDL